MKQKLETQLKKAGFPLREVKDSFIINGKSYCYPTTLEVQEECNKLIREQRENGTLKKGEQYLVDDANSVYESIVKLYIKIKKGRSELN